MVNFLKMFLIANLKSNYWFIWGVYFDAATGHSSQQQEINN
jgi:hypothetical protein